MRLEKGRLAQRYRYLKERVHLQLCLGCVETLLFWSFCFLTAGVPLALLEEPRRTFASATLGATLQARDCRVGCRRVETAAERLGDPAASVGKAEAAGWRAQAAGAASLGCL